MKDQEIIAAPADDIFFSVLEARSDKQSSLKDAPAYTRVAESLGDVLSAALVPQSQIHSQNVSAEWGNLHMYDLAGIGYRMDRQDRKVIIVLHYPDKSAAGDVEELGRRLADYSEITRNLETPRLADLFDIETPEATVYGTDSILKVELKYKSDTPSTLWSEMVESQDLGFLVVSPAG